MMTLQNKTQWIQAILAASPDWETLEATLPGVDALKSCIQDPVFHAEGNVWVHTRMVVERLIEKSDFHKLEEDSQISLLLAALLHDIGKPATTEVFWDATLGRERVSQPGHAKLGARMAWELLWKAGVPREIREKVYWLIAWHQKPFHLWNAKNMLREAISFSQVGIWNELLLLAEADNAGRVSANAEETVTALQLLRLWLHEQNLLYEPWCFANNESRIAFINKQERSAHYTAQPASGSHVIMLSGLPGSGKDTYIRQLNPECPVVSLDDIRRRLKIAATDNQGVVFQEVQNEARKYLRKNIPFIWNATNLTVSLRGKVLKLLYAYDAYVSIHAFDRSLQTLLVQNKAREAVVPETVIDRMVGKYEPPSILEAHEVIWIA